MKTGGDEGRRRRADGAGEEAETRGGGGKQGVEATDTGLQVETDVIRRID